MEAIVKKSMLKGQIDVISSKSFLHRAIILASLAKGQSKISNVYLSDDVLATINVCNNMGARIEIIGKDTLFIDGTNDIKKDLVFDACESGSTLRFLIPLLLLDDKESKIIGKGRLPKRPLDVYFDLFEQDKIDYQYENDYLPLKLKGALKGGEYKVRGDVSSQFITGLLLALPLLKCDSKIVVTTKLESKSYVDMTLEVLKQFGVNVLNNNYQEFIIKGNQQYKACSYQAEGDYSQAAFFLVSNMLGSEIKLNNLNINSTQGDKKIIDILKMFSSKENSLTIDLEDNPDLGPILFVLASRIKEKTHFINTKRLKIKESDRILDMKVELEKVGVIFEVNENDLYIKGNDSYFDEVTFDVHNDHRIAMSLIIYSLNFINKAIINGVNAINKSYPTFLSDIQKLGGDISCVPSKK